MRGETSLKKNSPRGFYGENRQFASNDRSSYKKPRKGKIFLVLFRVSTILRLRTAKKEFTRFFFAAECDII
ncbi:hypothetical protein CH380_16055 [Leptospira adleri]|uniref:Uncharacterized protein n=1 Tax=Leptospira adleri TaxID=2023186 RepID=A0A2M9YL55_9LEPT|nr:hypothetical protein CH380_16055 [Leptospira adleri]PJZ63234.1 hypothetical protein CH376_04185 [Leptospira adleri]